MNYPDVLPKPEAVFRFFSEICAIPHGSGNTGAICSYCEAFALKRSLKYHRDEFNNIIIYKDASAGCENAPSVIIQGHLDMVCEKSEESEIDFECDGLELRIDNDMIFAEGTSLGGDDGIAIAYALAVLDSKDIIHPPIEAVFTSDEETGMTGACRLDCSKLRSKAMLNLDSEEEGVFIVGCAGSSEVSQLLPVKREQFCGMGFEVKVCGLSGGHSGAEIHHDRANAICLAGQLLSRLSRELDVHVVNIFGGTKLNAIPVSAKLEIAINRCDVDKLVKAVEIIRSEIKKEFFATDPQLDIVLTELQEDCFSVLTDDSFRSAVFLMRINPNGVQSMNHDIAGLVQTSLNTAIVSTEDAEMKIQLFVRSMSNYGLSDTVDKLVSVCELSGGAAYVEGSYPPWECRKHSAIADLCRKVYLEQYQKEPIITAFHAGVECGIFFDKIKELDCVSFGPDIFDIHTCKERMSISSVERVWNLLLRILEELSKQ